MVDMAPRAIHSLPMLLRSMAGTSPTFTFTAPATLSSPPTIAFCQDINRVHTTGVVVGSTIKSGTTYTWQPPSTLPAGHYFLLISLAAGVSDDEHELHVFPEAGTVD